MVDESAQKPLWTGFQGSRAKLFQLYLSHVRVREDQFALKSQNIVTLLPKLLTSKPLPPPIGFLIFRRSWRMNIDESSGVYLSYLRSRFVGKTYTISRLNRFAVVDKPPTLHYRYAIKPSIKWRCRIQAPCRILLYHLPPLLLTYG